MHVRKKTREGGGLRLRNAAGARKLARMTVNLPAGAVPDFDLFDRLRKSREFSGLDQAALADRMGVSRGTVSNAERGRHAVRPIVVRMWALATGVDRVWLETGEAPTSPSGPQAYTTRDSNPEPAD